MRIGIWGFYRYGNYGDELMAVAIGKHLLAKGFKVGVYQLRGDLCRQNGFEQFNDERELCGWADALILGGGNLLAESKNWPIADYFSKLISDFLDALSFTRKPLVIVSVGGDGQTSFQSLLLPVRELLRHGSLLGVSVRLKSDRELLSEICPGNVECHPDILFGVASRIGALRPDAERRCVMGYHLSDSTFSHWRALGINALWRSTSIGRRREVVAISGFPESYGDYRPYGRNGNRALINNDPVDFTRSIMTMSHVVTHKLHVGLVAAVGGAKVLFVNAHPKVHAQMIAIGMEMGLFGDTWEQRFGCSRVAGLASGLRIAAMVRLRGAVARPTLVARLARESEQHMGFLARCLDQVRGTSRTSTSNPA